MGMEWVSWRGDHRSPCGGVFQRGGSGRYLWRHRARGVHRPGKDMGQSGMEKSRSRYLRDNRCTVGRVGGARVGLGVSPLVSGREVGRRAVAISGRGRRRVIHAASLRIQRRGRRRRRWISRSRPDNLRLPVGIFFLFSYFFHMLRQVTRGTQILRGWGECNFRVYTAFCPPPRFAALRSSFGPLNGSKWVQPRRLTPRYIHGESKTNLVRVPILDESYIIRTCSADPFIPQSLHSASITPRSYPCPLPHPYPAVHHTSCHSISRSSCSPRSSNGPDYFTVSSPCRKPLFRLTRSLAPPARASSYL